MYKISYSYNSAGCVPDSDSSVGNLLEFETLESLKDYMVDIIKFQFDDFDADEDYTEYLDALYAEIRKAESLQELPTFFDQNKGEYDLYSLEFEIEEILPPCVGDTLLVSELSDLSDIVNGGHAPAVTVIRDFLGRKWEQLFRYYFVKSVNGEYSEIWGSDSLDENATAHCLYIDSRMTYKALTIHMHLFNPLLIWEAVAKIISDCHFMASDSIQFAEAGHYGVTFDFSTSAYPLFAFYTVSLNDEELHIYFGDEKIIQHKQNNDTDVYSFQEIAKEAQKSYAHRRTFNILKSIKFSDKG